MPRALVTGGAGFLGSHLCDRLLAEGFEVVAFDNLLTGSTDNIAHLLDEPRFRYVHYDVCEYLYLDGPVDVVFHMASPASPVDFPTKPIHILKVNGIGTHRALGLARAKGARFLMASTSEVYGDPLIHPQNEEYWGNVNPIGVRGVYDEAKRYAEAMTMAYRRFHGVDTKIVRIFNSVLAHEVAPIFEGDEMHLMPVGEFARRWEEETIQRPRRLRIPAFNPASGKIALREASAFIKHPPMQKDAFRVRTRYGRDIQVTGDHSIFRRGKDGQPEAVPVRELAVGDHVAIAGYLPVVEKDRPVIHLGEEWIDRAVSPKELWDVALVAPGVAEIVDQHIQRITRILANSGRFDGSARPGNSVGCAVRKYRKQGVLPLYVFDRLRRETPVAWPTDARLRPYQAGATVSLPCELPVTDDLLWLMGLFLAEGTVASYVDKGTNFVTLASDQASLDRAQSILEKELAVSVGTVPPSAQRSPSIYVHGKMMCWLFGPVLGLGGRSHDKRIPAWVFQLPLSRFKHFLEGYREGDGTHSGVSVGKKLNFVTVSENLARDLVYALLRFGIVASLGRYESAIRHKSAARRYPFYSLTVCSLSNFDILSWDEGVKQNLNAGRFGDLVWAKITGIEPVETTDYVYDFSVPHCENFMAGSGVLAHNTYGPRMRLNDGRVVPNFVGQALRGDPITVYGTGQQTRSFCYVADLIDGIFKLAMSKEAGPINVGNPTERTMLEFAQEIKRLTNSPSEIVFQPLPTADDPKQRRPDITKAKTLLGWEPKVSLEDGLKLTIDYFQKKIAEQKASG
jgi:UDP-glucuronate decarboxylase